MEHGSTCSSVQQKNMKNVFDLLEFFCSAAAQQIRNLELRQNHTVLRRAALSDPERAPDRARLGGM
jgi:hypothetical protein